MFTSFRVAKLRCPIPTNVSDMTQNTKQQRPPKRKTHLYRCLHSSSDSSRNRVSTATNNQIYDKCEAHDRVQEKSKSCCAATSFAMCVLTINICRASVNGSSIPQYLEFLYLCTGAYRRLKLSRNWNLMGIPWRMLSARQTRSLQIR